MFTTVKKHTLLEKFPGGYFKREGRPTEVETLTSRLIDRPLRPLFPDFFKEEVQVNCMLLSLDKDNPPDVVAMLAASAAMSIADVPFMGPIAGARVGFIDDEYVLNPSFEKMGQSDLDMIIAGSENAVLMVESDANELSEDLMIGGILFAHQEMKPVIMQLRILQMKSCLKESNMKINMQMKKSKHSMLLTQKLEETLLMLLLLLIKREK